MPYINIFKIKYCNGLSEIFVRVAYSCGVFIRAWQPNINYIYDFFLFYQYHTNTIQIRYCLCKQPGPHKITVFSLPLYTRHIRETVNSIKYQQTLILVFFQIFSLLHRARCRVTQSLHQPLHIYKIYKNLHITTLITFRHVSVLRPSSGRYIFLAKVTLEVVAY